MLSASLSLTDMLLSSSSHMSSSHMHAPIGMALEDALGETFQQHRTLLRAVRTVLLALLPQLAMFSYWLHAQLVKLWTSADKQHYDFVLQLFDNDDNTYSLKRRSHAESFVATSARRRAWSRAGSSRAHPRRYASRLHHSRLYTTCGCRSA